MALMGDVESAGRRLLKDWKEGARHNLGLAWLGRRAEARQRAMQDIDKKPHDYEQIWVFAELGDMEEVALRTRFIDATPLGSLQFLRLIYYSGGYVPFDMNEAPGFRARLIEAGGDPDALPKWVPLSRPRDNK